MTPKKPTTHTILVRSEAWEDRVSRDRLTSKAIRSTTQGFRVLIMNEHGEVLETFDPPNTLEGWTKNIQDTN